MHNQVKSNLFFMQLRIRCVSECHLHSAEVLHRWQCKSQVWKPGTGTRKAQSIYKSMWINNTSLTFSQLLGITKLNSILSLWAAELPFEFLFLYLSLCFLCGWKNYGAETSSQVCSTLGRYSQRPRQYVKGIYCFVLLLPAAGRCVENFTDHLLFYVRSTSLQLSVHNTVQRKKTNPKEGVFP